MYSTTLPVTKDGFPPRCMHSALYKEGTGSDPCSGILYLCIHAAREGTGSDPCSGILLYL